MPGLIILDRDGVLNEMVVDAEHGTIDSPLHESQVVMVAGAAQALVSLNDLGYLVAIATNQPAAAKHKTTRENLEAVHRRVLSEARACGARIVSSHICFHRREEGCECRKPKPGLLHEALATNAASRDESWMVGDGVTDIEAGRRAGLKTAFLAPKKWDACRILGGPGGAVALPDFWGDSLAEFARFLAERRESAQCAAPR